MNESTATVSLGPPRFVATLGHEIAVFDSASAALEDAVPLVLLHGLGMSPQVWPTLLAQAFARRRCVAIALPGHHPSRTPGDFRERDVSPALFSQALLSAIDAVIGPETAFDLLGHCLGGHAALAIAATAPGRVRRLASVSGFVQGHYTGTLGALQWLARRKHVGTTAFSAALATLLATPRMADLSLLSATGRPRACHQWAAEHGLLTTLIDGIRRGESAGLGHLLAGVYALDLTEALGRIVAPTRIVHGTHDPIVAFAQARLLSHGVPHAELVSLDGIGHLPFGEAQTALNQSLNPWFDL